MVLRKKSTTLLLLWLLLLDGGKRRGGVLILFLSPPSVFGMSAAVYQNSLRVSVGTSIFLVLFLPS